MYDDEIEMIESTLYSLVNAIDEISDSPYYNYMAHNWQCDVEELQRRLDELEELRSREWRAEKEQQNSEYERSVL